MSSDRAHEYLQAEARYYKDQVALLRAKLYRWGVGSTDRLRELEEKLRRAEARLSDSAARSEERSVRGKR